MSYGLLRLRALHTKAQHSSVAENNAPAPGWGLRLAVVSRRSYTAAFLVLEARPGSDAD
jgi:hypothetical protein